MVDTHAKFHVSIFLGEGCRGGGGVLGFWGFGVLGGVTSSNLKTSVDKDI